MPTVKETIEFLNKFDENDIIATTIWFVEDVLSLKPELTDNQAEGILESAHDNFDANLGINWDSLEHEISKIKTNGE